jgi:L-arabonate dehydrase
VPERPVPTLVKLLPSGRYLMEDFCCAGGIPAIMRALATCCTLGSSVSAAEPWPV